jgi:hypothetical protein
LAIPYSRYGATPKGTNLYLLPFFFFFFLFFLFFFFFFFMGMGLFGPLPMGQTSTIYIYIFYLWGWPHHPYFAQPPPNWPWGRPTNPPLLAQMDGSSHPFGFFFYFLVFFFLIFNFKFLNFYFLFFNKVYDACQILIGLMYNFVSFLNGGLIEVLFGYMP